MRLTLIILALSVSAVSQTGNGCSTNTAATTGSAQSYGFCQPFVIDGRNKGGWIALNRAGDLSNSELQCYDPQSVSINNGLLTISTTQRTKTCHYWPAQTGTASFNGSFSSGFVQWNTYSFTFGEVLVRAKGPSLLSGGDWPAIWLLGSNCELSSKVTADNALFNGKTCAWPAAGSEEIDIFEQHSGDALTSQRCNFFSATISPAAIYTITDSSAAFHVYGVRWTSGQIQWTYDGVVQAGCTVTDASVPSTPMFLQINIAMAVNAVNSGTPATLQTDWVKVCQPSPCNGSGSNVAFFDDFIVPPTITLVKPLIRAAKIASAGTPPATNPEFTMGVAKNEEPKLK